MDQRQIVLGSILLGAALLPAVADTPVRPGLAIGPTKPSQGGVQPYSFHDDPPDAAIPFAVSEPDQGADLNGDGDKEDFVLHVRRAADGAVINLGLAVQDVAGSGGRLGISSVSGDLVAFAVGEQAQGGTDLNGDGDTNDFVLHVY